MSISLIQLLLVQKWTGVRHLKLYSEQASLMTLKRRKAQADNYDNTHQEKVSKQKNPPSETNTGRIRRRCMITSKLYVNVIIA